MAVAEAKTHGFQTEVKQLLKLMIHSLYSNKEIFLRELVSNAADAIDKLRFEAVSNESLYENDAELKVWVEPNTEARTLTIRDNGIGMSQDEVMENLGTIAKSGTKQFLESLSGDQAKDAHLIGQFGVGFYSAFMVADRVVVKTRRAGAAADSGTVWISAGEGEYSIEDTHLENRGTEITLHLKEDDSEFLEEYRLKNIIQTYSDHISTPIFLITHEEQQEEAQEGEEPKPAETVRKEEQANSATALWTRAKSEITDEQYAETYKQISHDFEEPLIWSHNKVEGKTEYTSLLYIPKKAPFDLFNREKREGIKLYVRRIFIMDDAEHLLPNYLRFVRGVIDSNDLPLNVSREILQSNKIIDTIRTAAVKRVLGLIEKIVKDDDQQKYIDFWAQFGRVLKEGPAEDFANRERIAKLFRFASTHTGTETQTVSFEDYIARMKEGQDKIYYITAESYAAAKNSPQLEAFASKEIEVLLLSDSVDEWWISYLNEFEGKKLQSASKGTLDLGDDEATKEKQEQLEGDNADLIKQVKEALGDKVKDVRVSLRLTASPACIVADENDMSAHMQRIMSAAGQSMPMAKPILELNPEHALFAKLQAAAGEDSAFADWSNVLLDQAILAEGGQLEDPASFVKRMNGLLV
ncbi:High temperature protein G [Piscirickettsia salmonis]|uniref:molecular chaperone HtpG n=1 Tax=Piscirickettsia salmonis TaxID=1238 RepID=UPI0012BACF92|nr:molecular chaperone HtpG [Piscirickettsia salmonis]QGP54073.1 High temperature protein G [Piscirickettsia salmonis]QGP60033.1 High temperature protein G [Piscirickettsia salmonis]QGP63650.1 High temperature protein G [Piscirickettsia salmonis]